MALGAWLFLFCAWLFLSHAGARSPCTRSPTHALATLALSDPGSDTHALGRVAPLYGRNPRARGTYIVVTRTHTHLHTHTTPHPIRLRENCCKSAGQRHDIVVSGSKQTSRKNLYPYSYVVRIFLYPKGSSMDVQAVIEKVLEQYKRGLLTTEETRLEITEVLYTDLVRNTPRVSDFDVQA